MGATHPPAGHKRRSERRDAHSARLQARARAPLLAVPLLDADVDVLDTSGVLLLPRSISESIWRGCGVRAGKVNDVRRACVSGGAKPPACEVRAWASASRTTAWSLCSANPERCIPLGEDTGEAAAALGGRWLRAPASCARARHAGPQLAAAASSGPRPGHLYARTWLSTVARAAAGAAGAGATLAPSRRGEQLAWCAHQRCRAGSARRQERRS